MLLTALVPEIVVEIGAVAGIAAFLGISLVTIILLVMARDVRRLRDWAGRAPEREAEEREEALAAAAARAERARLPEDEGGTGDLPHGDPLEAEAQAARIRAERQRPAGNGAGAASRIGGSPVAKVILAAVAAILVAGGAYLGVGQLTGDDGPAAGQAGQRGQGQGQGERRDITERALDPSQVQVAVLNGTNASGLASAFQDGVASAGYQIGIVGNSQSTYSESRVMFIQGHRPEAVALAREFEISQVEPMVDEVSEVVEGAPVAVILGDDKVPSA